MNIDQMRYFLEVARCKSLLVASKHLYITQPTLSRQISNMEAELNMQLFIRNNQGMKLTTAGDVLYHEWTKTLDVYDESLEKALYAFKGLTGTVSIGILDGLKMDTFFPQAIEYMQKNHPNINILLKRLSFKELIEKLNHKEIDIAISLDGNFLHHSGIKVQNILAYHPAIAVPLRNPLAKKADITFADFKDEPLAIVSREECAAGVEQIIEACKRLGDFHPDFYFVDSMANAILWVEAGLKCAILNDQMQIADSPMIKMVPLAGDEEGHYVQQAYADDNDNFALKVWLKYFEKEIS